MENGSGLEGASVKGNQGSRASISSAGSKGSYKEYKNKLNKDKEFVDDFKNLILIKVLHIHNFKS